jgi:predicted phosphodiesterase
MYVYPKVESGTQVLVCWDGIKETFSAADEVPFDEQMAEAVATFVKAHIIREVDKDIALAREYMRDYTGDASQSGQRTRLYLNAKRRTEIAPSVASPTPDAECSTLVGATDIVEFVALGDSGDLLAQTDTIEVANLVKSLRPDFIVHLGDGVDVTGDPASIYQCLTRHFFGWIPDGFYLAFGNHDIQADAGAGLAALLTLQAALNSGKFYYDFVIGDLHAWVLNGNPTEPDGNTAGSVQGAWLQAGLAASTEAWNVVFVHQAPYTSDVLHTPGYATIRWPFKAWGADLVVSGHCHNYERIRVADLDYLICGLGGDTIRAFGAPTTGVIFQYGAPAALHGCLRLSVTADRLTATLFNVRREAVDRLVLKA